MTIVVTLAFGWFIFGALALATEPSAVSYRASDFIAIAIFEIVVGTTLLGFLFLRGWRVEELGFVRFRRRDVLDGLIIFGAIWLIAWATTMIFTSGLSAFEETLAAGEFVDQMGVGWVTALVFSLINACFEELFVCAYIIAAWRGPSASLAILLSAILRLSYHMYQGPIAILAILPFGLIFAWYFHKTRRVVPLIALHFIFDVLALLPYIRF